jgi:hypothetical protein
MNGWMAAKACTALLISLSVAACSSADQGARTAQAMPANGAFAALNAVPLNLPRLEPGQSCPLSKLSQVGPNLGMGLGSGPVYVFSGEIVSSDPKHSNKVAWAADPSYSGPIRIRGGRIGGAGQLLLDSFDNMWRGAPVKTVDGSDLAPELDLLESHSTFPNVPPGWRMWPSGTYVAAPGCYAWQVDGLGFTELITFHSLDLPTLTAGKACPVSAQQVAHSLSAEFGYGPAVGAGPIYALMGEMQAGVLKYQPQANSWTYSKVLWMAKPEVSGSVLVRGRQIDGPTNGSNWIGFGMRDVPEFVLRWEVASHDGWASLPSEIWIQSPGCYASQVDSQSGSEVIVFQVVGTP